MQYGVGQGGFHSTSFSLFSDARAKRLLGTYELVFDCGTLSKGPGGESNVDFIGRHINNYHPQNGVIDALFISHLDGDHVNGAAQLCTRKKVKRIFLPYFSQDELALFVANQLVNNDASALGPSGLALITNALKGGGFIDADVTLIGAPEPNRNGDGDVAPQTANQTQITLDELTTNGPRPIGPFLPGQVQLSLSFGSPIPWVLIPWSYKQSPTGLSTLLASVPILQKLIASKSITASDIEQIADKDKAEIRKALTELIQKAGGIYATDFNAPSICLYSGPPEDLEDHVKFHYSQRGTTHSSAQNDPPGWLTTGDAILSKYELEFMDVFKEALKRTGTYVLPHHGAKKNHSAELISRARGRFALICAKHGSEDHPYKEVLATVANYGDDHRILTQYAISGVDEHIEMLF